jgi:hypothetical protein
MSTEIPSRADAGSRAAAWAKGLTVLAGVLMLVGGIWQVIAGITALINSQFYVTTPNYVYMFDFTSWGWIHLILGALVAVAGVAVLKDATWGRAIGVGLVVLSMFANFLFIPYYPLWAIAVIVLDAVILWALIVPREDLV